MPREPLPVCNVHLCDNILLVLVRIMWRLGVSHKEHKAWKRSPLLPTPTWLPLAHAIVLEALDIPKLSYLIDEWVVLVLPCQ